MIREVYQSSHTAVYARPCFVQDTSSSYITEVGGLVKRLLQIQNYLCSQRSMESYEGLLISNHQHVT